MNYQQKMTLVSDLKENFTHKSAFLVNYRGLNVSEMQGLRRDVKRLGGQMQVAKVRLMKLAIQNLPGVQNLIPLLSEQLAVVFSADDAVPDVIKSLSQHAKKTEALELIGGFFEAQLFDKIGLQFLINLPSREQLLAQLCGVLQAPMYNLAGILHLLLLRLVVVLQKIAEQKGQ